LVDILCGLCGFAGNFSAETQRPQRKTEKKIGSKPIFVSPHTGEKPEQDIDCPPTFKNARILLSAALADIYPVLPNNSYLARFPSKASPK